MGLREINDWLRTERPDLLEEALREAARPCFLLEVVKRRQSSSVVSASSSVVVAPPTREIPE